MNRYLIESTHIDKDCHHVLEQFMFHGYIINFDWGCEDGIHSGWAVIDAVNQSEALLSVPPYLRSKARAIRLKKYTPEMMRATHA